MCDDGGASGRVRVRNPKSEFPKPESMTNDQNPKIEVTPESALRRTFEHRFRKLRFVA